jgi:hypothetical protein
VLKVTGKLVSKSLLKSGTSTRGPWQLVDFVIEKQMHGKKIPIAFIALGKQAEKLGTIQVKQRVTVYFFPHCTQFNNKWYSELKVLDIELYQKIQKTYNQKDAIEGTGAFSMEGYEDKHKETAAVKNDMAKDGKLDFDTVPKTGFDVNPLDEK